ncbi:MAG: hypothetical protein IPL86_17010 [Flavobacteriales bacterium]|nr:hypothetical protein [Flavobacteriales bacterium]
MWRKVKGGFGNEVGASAYAMQLLQAGAFGLIVAQDGNSSFNKEAFVQGKWAVWAQNQAAWDSAQQAATSGAQGGGSQAAAGPLGLSNAGSMQLQGGADIPRGATSLQGVGVDVRSEFLGLSTFAPDTQIGPQHAAYAENVDGISARGALSKRPGLIPLYPNRNTEVAAQATLRLPTKANITASTDYILFTLPNADTHAFWFDTTGADSEPAGSVSATNSTVVDVSGATTALQVAAALFAAINAAVIGVTCVAGPGVVAGDVNVFVDTPGIGGNSWVVEEFMTHASASVASDFAGGWSGVSSSRKGRSINALPEGFRNAGRATLVLGYDNSSDLGGGIASAGTTELRAQAVDTTYNAQRNIARVKPVIAPVSNASGVVTFRATMPQAYRKETGNDEGIVASVDQLVVVASKNGFCLDRDLLDKLEGVRHVKDYTSWDGNTVSIVDSGLDAGDVWFYSVWAVNKREVSLGAFYSVEVA